MLKVFNEDQLRNFEYVAIDEDKGRRIEIIRDAIKKLIYTVDEQLDGLAPSRHSSLFLTSLEQAKTAAVMAVSHAPYDKRVKADL